MSFDVYQNKNVIKLPRDFNSSKSIARSLLKLARKKNELDEKFNEYKAEIRDLAKKIIAVCFTDPNAGTVGFVDTGLGSVKVSLSRRYEYNNESVEKIKKQLGPSFNLFFTEEIHLRVKSDTEISIIKNIFGDKFDEFFIEEKTYSYLPAMVSEIDKNTDTSKVLKEAVNIKDIEPLVKIKLNK